LPGQDDLVDSFPHFYRSTFSEEIQKSIEGKEVAEVLSRKWISSHDGVMAPEFTSYDIDGNKINLNDYKGRYVLINFWATWCAPCIAEMPAIIKIRELYPDDRLTIISVSSDEDYAKFKKAIKKYKMEWINVYRDEQHAAL